MLNLKQLPLKELLSRIDHYKSFEPRGMNYQADLNRLEAELERRFLVWEMA